jgi:hypothetical protein
MVSWRLPGLAPLRHPLDPHHAPRLHSPAPLLFATHHVCGNRIAHFPRSWKRKRGVALTSQANQRSVSTNVSICPNRFQKRRRWARVSAVSADKAEQIRASAPNRPTVCRNRCLRSNCLQNRVGGTIGQVAETSGRHDRAGCGSTKSVPTQCRNRVAARTTERRGCRRRRRECRRP